MPYTSAAASDMVKNMNDSSPKSSPLSSRSNHAGQHPALKSMCVMDCATLTEIVPNSGPMTIDNECFQGQVFLLVRTPDVDDPTQVDDSMADTPKRISQYLKGKQRRFEFQFQVKLKKVPTGPLFLGCEVEHPIKVSRFTKGLAGVLLAMIRRINSGFHYSWGVDHKKKTVDGKYEKTHLSFPVEASMDRIVITKPGETPPQLGHELYESNESVKRRRRMGAGSVDWNLQDTYTMCLWSAYCDWIKWKTLNVPGVRPFSLGIVTGRQPIYLSVYELRDMTPAEYKKRRPPHNRNQLDVYTRLEFSHVLKTDGGLAAGTMGKDSSSTALDCSLVETESDVGSESELTET